MLPLPADQEILTLGEGWTPLLTAPHLAARCGLNRLWIKEESQNPTGSFKARGMAVAGGVGQYLWAPRRAGLPPWNTARGFAPYTRPTRVLAARFYPQGHAPTQTSRL